MSAEKSSDPKITASNENGAPFSCKVKQCCNSLSMSSRDLADSMKTINLMIDLFFEKVSSF